MKYPHLFFIEIKDKINKYYYYSMIYNMDENEKNTVKGNIITIIKYLINTCNLFDINESEFDIIEVTNDTLIKVNKLNKYLSNVIYLDNNINEYICVNKNSSDYNILNVIRDNLKVNILLIGDKLDVIVKDNKKRNEIINFFNFFYYKNPTNIALYKPTSESNVIDVDELCSILNKDRDTINCIILEDNSSISLINKFINKMNDNFNIDLFIKYNNEYYSISGHSDQIIYKRVSYRN